MEGRREGGKEGRREGGKEVDWKHQGHGVDVGLLEGLDVLQVESGLQHLRSHVARRAHLRHRDTGR
ncbi:hypothetical protein EYF80_010982 [Liparis tanakae]|uniref:Uncharacterized protein n=1 Tax=Liparis tanakae TaxID=230148 RepID=A0A4Z2INK6_9TELE|nr:hypothetical protein EYF80_010982 [Liparis tanakae]